ncbi:DUF1294 domain-containing protein [Paenibacillus sp. YYML68]|uniref:DUF1294 domain-containing protein n=1 Tax=Paenibacillus sp. YYML68 TaxID=2909250 RepID=UPI002491057A|nr:DUF1294 domain-containing protein [Paenibacillus sp. YYML68]
MLALASYVLIMNVLGFIMMGVDKQKARRKNRRISEKRLFVIALALGAAGVWLGMQIWRHKTKHDSFIIGIPLLFVLNVLCIYVVLKQFYDPQL